MPAVVLTAVADGATIVAAPSGATQFIRVIGGELFPSTTGTYGLKSNSTLIWNGVGNVSLNVNGGRTIDCLPGQALKASYSGGTLTGTLEYIVLGIPDLAHN